MEEWKDIEDYEGLYQVSSEGRVKSLNYHRTGEERILKNCKNNRGYLQVILYKDGKLKSYLIHRLVASSFLDNPDNLPEVNHLNEVKTDNQMENLEWCSAEHNMNYGTRTERTQKPVLQFSKTGEFIRKWESGTQIEKELGIHPAHISSCCKRKRKSAYGFIWMYAKIGVFEIDINKLKKVA